MTRSPRRADDGSRRRRGEPVVARVLDLTLEALATGGFHRLSVPEIAERAGLNKTSVYRRWPTKDALVAAALERAMGHDGEIPETGSMRTDIDAFVLAAAKWADSPLGRGVMKTLLAEADDPDVRASVSRLVRARAGGPRIIFERAVARGELDPRADVRMAMTVIAGAISHRTLVEGARVTPAFVSRLVALVVDGFVGVRPSSRALRVGDPRKRPV